MIAIKSNKELYFPDGKGFVTIEIDVIQNYPKLKIYTMRLVDTCYKEIQEEDDTITIKYIGMPKTRFKTMTYDELDELSKLLNLGIMTSETLRRNIDESFRQGLLLTTQQECIDGVNGEPGKGQYYSEAQDWEIIRDPSDDRRV